MDEWKPDLEYLAFIEEQAIVSGENLDERMHDSEGELHSQGIYTLRDLFQAFRIGEPKIFRNMYQDMYREDIQIFESYKKVKEEFALTFKSIKKE